MSQGRKRLGRTPRLENLEGRLCLSGSGHLHDMSLALAIAGHRQPKLHGHPQPKTPTVNGSIHGTFSPDGNGGVQFSGNGNVQPLGHVQSAGDLNSFGPNLTIENGKGSITLADGTTSAPNLQSKSIRVPVQIVQTSPNYSNLVGESGFAVVKLGRVRADYSGSFTLDVHLAPPKR